MTESTIRSLAEAGAPAVTAKPYLAEQVLATLRRSRSRRRAGALAVAGLIVVGGTVAARSGGQSRYFSQYEPSGSMAPTVAVREHLISDRTLEPTYGDLVVITLHADGRAFDTIKRVIGLPGDRIACPPGVDGRCHGWTRNGVALHETYAHDDPGAVAAPLRVPAGGVFVLGDARDVSADSRQMGPARLADVRGVGVEVQGARGRSRAVAGAPAHPGPHGRNVDPAVIPPAQDAPS